MREDIRRRNLKYHLWTIVSYFLTNVTAGLLWILYFALNRTTVVGREHTRRPSFSNTLLVSNHQSMIDSWAIGVTAFYPRSWLWPHLLPWNAAAYENFFRPWWLGVLSSLWKCIPVREGRRDLVALKRMMEVMPRGVMTLFPEGTRARTGDVGPARGGAGMLVLMTRATVMPVALEGMQDVLPIGSKIPRVFKRVYIAFGPPIDYSDLADERSKENAQAVVDRIMDQVRLLHADLRRRRLADLGQVEAETAGDRS